MSKRLKIAVVGVGAMGSGHAGAVRATRGTELTALCDIDERALTAGSKRHNVVDLYTDHREMIAEADIDAVLIAAPNCLHAPITIAALNAGKHVLCEKPMAMSLREAKAMVAVAKKARRRGKVLQVAVCLRQQPDALAIRKLVESGKLGNIYHIRAVMIRRRGIPGLGGWFTTMAESGGGPVMDLGVHWLDMAMHLSGNWQPTTVSGATHAKFGPAMKDYLFDYMWAGPPKYNGTFDVEDYTAGFIRFRNGMSLTYDICWAANAQDELFVQLFGDKGGASVTLTDKVTLYTQSKRKLRDVTVKPTSTENRYERQLRLFVKAARGQGPVPATAEQGLVVAQVLDAINRSADGGKEVRIRD